MTSEAEHVFRISGMDCANCARSIETGIAKLDGVERCELSFATEKLCMSLYFHSPQDPDWFSNAVQGEDYINTKRIRATMNNSI